MKRILSFVLFMTTAAIGQAKDVPVRSLAELQQAVNAAKPGDRIVLADGKYTADQDIVVTCVGTKAQPVTIAAANQGKAEITGKGGIVLNKPAAYVIVSGFVFTHAANHARANVGTSFCTWQRNVFENPGDGENLYIAGSDHQVIFNTFRHKNAMGRFLAIRGEGKQIAERIHIAWNYFFDHKPQTGNGAESLQFGLSGFSLSTSNSIVENNLFEECAGENELISIKSSGVVLRDNTIRDSRAQVTLRHGNHNEVYDNYFFNTPGIRFFGDDQVIRNNYFGNCNPAIQIGNGGAEVADGAPLTSHDRPDRIQVVSNLSVDCPVHILMTGRKEGLGAIDVAIRKNVLIGGGKAAVIDGPLKNPVWEGNILVNVPEEAQFPASGRTVEKAKTPQKAGPRHPKPLDKSMVGADAIARKIYK
ncbi:polysaccharide lyase 6 family protein [Chitinophaga lutea]